MISKKIFFVFPLTVLAIETAEASCPTAKVVSGSDCNSLLVQLDLSGCGESPSKQIAAVTCKADGTAQATVKTAKSTYTVGLKPSGEGSSLKWIADVGTAKEASKETAKNSEAKKSTKATDKLANAAPAKAKAVAAPVATALAMSTATGDTETASADREPAHVKPATPTTEVPLDQPVKFSATAYLASDYIWRGQTFTPSGQPVIQGSGDVALPYGFGAGLFLSNLEYFAARSEADLYGTWAYSKDDWGIGTMAFWYNYVEDPGLNAMEYTLWARYKILKLETNYLPEYFGLDSTALYSRATITQPLTDKQTLNLAIGYFSLGNEALVAARDGFLSYMDYEISLVHAAESFNIEFQYTDTNRRNATGVAYNDRALTFILSRTF